MQKMKCIQGIRGLAISLIVLWHLNSVFPNCLPAFGDRGGGILFSSFWLINRNEIL